MQRRRFIGGATVSGVALLVFVTIKQEGRMLIQQSKFGSYVGGYDGGTNLTAVTSLEAKIGKLDILSSFDSWGADLLNANTLAVRSAAASR